MAVLTKKERGGWGGGGQGRRGVLKITGEETSLRPAAGQES